MIPKRAQCPARNYSPPWAATTTSFTKAGLLVDLAGLLPSSEGRRVRFSGGSRAVVAGPFDESKKLIAGYWILQVQSMDHAVEWARRAPFEALSRIYPGEYGAEGEIEIRQVFEPDAVS